MFGAINKQQFESLELVEASSEVLKGFQSLASPLDTQIRFNIVESRNLTNQRDSLLPKLVSGEIGVRDAT